MVLEENLPPLESEPTTVRKSRRPTKAFWAGFGAGLVVSGLVAGLSFGIPALIDHFSSPDTFSIAGTMQLSGSITTSGLPTGFDCAGAGGYSDIAPGTAVTVSDGSGKLLALGELDSSISADSSTCVFAFVVHNVPRDAQFYKVEVGHRGALSYTQSEAAKGLSFTLGS